MFQSGEILLQQAGKDLVVVDNDDGVFIIHGRGAAGAAAVGIL
jgi:hypothetical protein